MMRILMLAGLVPALALAPAASPALAQDACNSWTAEVQEDEGGPVLTASACAIGRPDAFLSLTCFSGNVDVRHDLSVGAERSPDLDEVTDVAFTIDGATRTLSMAYQAMDGRHAAGVPVSSPLLALLRSGESLSIVDVAGQYPRHEFSLTGSAGAIGALLAGCN